MRCIGAPSPGAVYAAGSGVTGRRSFLPHFCRKAGRKVVPITAASILETASYNKPRCLSGLAIAKQSCFC